MLFINKIISLAVLSYIITIIVVAISADFNILSRENNILPFYIVIFFFILSLTFFKKRV